MDAYRIPKLGPDVKEPKEPTEALIKQLKVSAGKGSTDICPFGVLFGSLVFLKTYTDPYLHFKKLEFQLKSQGVTLP